MIINRDSLHYRFNLWMSKHDYEVENHKSLCSYFWLTVFHILKCASVFYFVWFLITLPALALLGTNTGWVDYVMTFPFYSKWPTMLGVGAVMWAILAGFLACICMGYGAIVERIKHWKYHRDMKKHFDENGDRITPVKKESGLFVSYLKAKKSKVCPIIEYKGDVK